MTGVRVDRGRLGGFTARDRPAFGLRPSLLFMMAVALDLAYLAAAVSISSVWRDELEAAIGPVAGWVIPIFMAYIPAIVIGFLCFTLIFTRYRPPPLRPPAGRWLDGEWPAVTVIVAAYNEEEAIEPTATRAR